MKRWKYIRICSMIVCVLLIFSAAAPLFDVSAALTASQANINKLQDQLKKIGSEKKSLEQKQEDLGKDIDKQLQVKASLDESISLTESEIETTKQLIAELNEQIRLTEIDLTEKKQQEADQYTKFKQRLRVMYENGEMSYLDVILSAGSLSQMLSRVDIIGDIMENDKVIMAELEAVRVSIEEDKAELESDRTEVEKQRSALDAKKDELEERYKSSEALINKLSKQESKTAGQLNDLEAEEERIAKEIAKMAAELAKKQSAQYVGGQFSWPLPGHTYISSYFGMRKHPITGVYKLHTGIDIPAPRNTKILAANSGTVLMAHYNTAYGNMVTINHGGGYVTLYAHMTKDAVSVGDYVKKGQVIGYVGSTGYSTGPHLHFEIQKDGTHVNPLNYFTLK